MAAKKAPARKEPIPEKRKKNSVTSKNYETGLTNMPGGLRNPPAGGYMTGKYATSTNKKGVVTGMGAQRNTNYIAPKKAAAKKKK
jgi:hypothetical protein